MIRKSSCRSFSRSSLIITSIRLTDRASAARPSGRQRHEPHPSCAARRQPATIEVTLGRGSCMRLLEDTHQLVTRASSKENIDRIRNPRRSEPELRLDCRELLLPARERCRFVRVVNEAKVHEPCVDPCHLAKEVHVSQPIRVLVQRPVPVRACVCSAPSLGPAQRFRDEPPRRLRRCPHTGPEHLFRVTLRFDEKHAGTRLKDSQPVPPWPPPLARMQTTPSENSPVRAHPEMRRLQPPRTGSPRAETPTECLPRIAPLRRAR